MVYSNHSLHVRKYENWKCTARAYLNGHYQRHNAEKGLVNKVQIRPWHKERAVASKEKGNYKANRRNSNRRVEVITIFLEQYSREEKKIKLIKANFE